MSSTRSLAIFLAALMVCPALPAVSAERATSSGTGFVINDGGWLVTNAHVIEDCDRVNISGSGDINERFVDSQNDLAVVRVSGPGFNIAPIAIRRAPPRLGEDVAALGYPLTEILSDSVKITTGNINSMIGLGNDSRYLQISTPIQPGNSGGPLVDKAGSLLGINTATLGTKFTVETGILAQNVNFAIRASVLEVFLQARGISYQNVETALPGLPTSDLAEKISPSVKQVFCFKAKTEVPPAASAPGQSMAVAPSTASMETRVRNFVISYHEALSGDNATAWKFMQGAYSGSVSYYGKYLSKEAVLAEKRKFMERWPNRNYVVQPDSVTVACAVTSCHVEALVDWQAGSPARKKTPSGVASMSIDWDTSLEVITSESSSVIKHERPDTKTASLISTWFDENSKCRGGAGNDPQTDKACARRETLSDNLYSMGWCYGKKHQYGYQMKWHQCTADSNR
ncbi:S1C family serine protease [Phyllobacterium bourgognense]|uniref:Trypsin-like peptidase n=1 Tax=Phyllobacterium bourgognense TaxID=314236 RepID=A0A368YP09_9HYPH|nr:serine protease [Phyllobacterium bourgognense]RCW81960.1 trypsin-like peptidase [Phyllobacterium bourgognense]